MAKADRTPYQYGFCQKAETSRNDDESGNDSPFERKKAQKLAQLLVLRQKTPGARIEFCKDAKEQDLQSDNRHHARHQQCVGIKLAMHNDDRAYRQRCLEARSPK